MGGTALGGGRSQDLATPGHSRPLRLVSVIQAAPLGDKIPLALQ